MEQVETMRESRRRLAGPMKPTSWCPLLAVALTLVSCASAVRRAPATAALPLPPGAHVVLSLAGGDDVDPAYNPQRFRYMVISGARGMSSTAFLLSEARVLRDNGWAHEQAWIIAGNSGNASSTSTTTRGATVQLDRQSSGQYIYTEIDIIGRHDNLALTTDGDPRYPFRHKIRIALDTGAPVLDVLLGNGKATRVN